MVLTTTFICKSPTKVDNKTATKPGDKQMEPEKSDNNKENVKLTNKQTETLENRLEKLQLDGNKQMNNTPDNKQTENKQTDVLPNKQTAALDDKDKKTNTHLIKRRRSWFTSWNQSDEELELKDLLLTMNTQCIPSLTTIVNKLKVNDSNPKSPTFTNITIVGEPKVGKSSIVKRLQMGKFSKTYLPTYGVEKSHVAYQPPPSSDSSDSPSDPLHFRFITSNDVFICPAMALTLDDRLNGIIAHTSRHVVIVYDVTNHRSFESVRQWLDLMEDFLHPNCSLTLVGNKADREKDREVHKTAGEVFAMLHNMYFVETSAKSGLNLKHLFYKFSDINNDTAC